MEQWLNEHGSTLTEEQWTERLSRMESFRDGVASRRSEWIVLAIDAAQLFERTRSHLNVKRIEQERHVSYRHRGTDVRAVEKQWQYFLQDDYDPCPF